MGERKGIRKGTGVPGSGLHFLKNVFVHCHVTFLQHKLFLFATQTSLVLCSRAPAASLRGAGRYLSRATHELFAVGFFHLALTHRRLPETSPGQGTWMHAVKRSPEGAWLQCLAQG